MLRRHGEFAAAVTAAGATIVSGEALAPTATATTVRMGSGSPVVTDGPFAELKEGLGGYSRSTAPTSTRRSASPRHCRPPTSRCARSSTPRASRSLRAAPSRSRSPRRRRPGRRAGAPQRVGHRPRLGGAPARRRRRHGRGVHPGGVRRRSGDLARPRHPRPTRGLAHHHRAASGAGPDAAGGPPGASACPIW